MKQQTVRRIVWMAACIGLVVDIVAYAIVVPTWTGHPVTGAFVTTTATAVMLATLALQVTVLILQIFPNGGAMIPAPMFGDDGLLFVIASTGIPGVLWYNLAALADPFMRVNVIQVLSPATAIASAFLTPLFTSLLLLVFRLNQRSRFKAISS